MNEIRNIHLGRQAYTVSADAYKDLHDYLQAIQKKVGKDVAEEVELRMAELLTERGISGEQVVLQKDVDYLKEQLGTPGDFGDDSSEDESVDNGPESQKRLFRDTDNALIAGVAAGLAKYLDIDVVIVRLVFVALTFFGASGIIAYIVLWLLVPEARTSSDRLQMSGQAVNVDTIKQAIARADMPGATRRASATVYSAFRALLRVASTVIGVGFIIGAVMMLLGSAIATAYGLIHGVRVDNVALFPIGKEQEALLITAMITIGLLAVMTIALGMALVRKKWLIPGWVSAVVIGMFIASASLCSALAVDIGPAVQNRYDSFIHTKSYAMQPIKSVHVSGYTADVEIRYAATPSVQVHTFGNVDTNAVQVKEVNGALTIGTDKFHPPVCHLFCPYGEDRTQIVVYTNNADTVPLSVDGVDGIVQGQTYADPTQKFQYQ